MNVVFFGMNTSFSAIHLLALRTQHTVAGVFVTAVENSSLRERGKKIYSAITGRVSSGAFSLEKSCRVYGIPFYEVQSINGDDAVDLIKKINPDVICMAGFSEKIKRPVIELAKYGIYNSHTSILPHYRGANPFFWMIKRNKMDAGCTIHKVDEGLDSGDIAASESFVVYPGINLAYYNTIASSTGSKLLLNVLNQMESGTISHQPNKSTDNLNSRNPNSSDLVLTADYTCEYILWMFNAFSDSKEFLIDTAAGKKRCNAVSVQPFENSEPYQVSDGIVYISVS